MILCLLISEPSDSPIITSVKGELQVNSTYPKTKLIVKWRVGRYKHDSC